MSRSLGVISLAAFLALFAWGGLASAQNTSLKDCTKVAEVTSPTTLSSKPSLVCGVQLFATAANATVNVYDSPGASTHGQAKVVAEQGVATDQTHGYPVSGKWHTRFGLGVDVENGRALISWDD